ncbi:MAG: hypothetical protein RLZZ422_1309 [Pseudomonadota bacterium]|jgi:hypothetical protein
MNIIVKTSVLALFWVSSITVQAEDDLSSTLQHLLGQHRQTAQGSILQQGLNSAVNSLSTRLQNDLFEGQGVDITPVTTEFDGVSITYQFQFWKIRYPSICSDLTGQLAKYSECTQAAKALFQASCQELKKDADKFMTQPRLLQVSNMYCDAAMKFKPTIAQIAKSKPITDKVRQLRQTCNSLIISAMISGSTKDKKERDKACDAYKKASQ